jgi:hypothetical protein
MAVKRADQKPLETVLSAALQRAIADKEYYKNRL